MKRLLENFSTHFFANIEKNFKVKSKKAFIIDIEIHNNLDFSPLCKKNCGPSSPIFKPSYRARSQNLNKRGDMVVSPIRKAVWKTCNLPNLRISRKYPLYLHIKFSRCFIRNLTCNWGFVRWEPRKNQNCKNLSKFSILLSSQLCLLSNFSITMALKMSHIYFFGQSPLIGHSLLFLISWWSSFCISDWNLMDLVECDTITNC